MSYLAAASVLACVLGAVNLVLVMGVIKRLWEMTQSTATERPQVTIRPGEKPEPFTAEAVDGGVIDAGLGAINTAERRVDRRRLAVQVLVGSLGAAVAGGGLIWLTRSGSHSVGDLSVFLVAVAGVWAALGNGVQQIASTHEALLVFEHHASATEPVVWNGGSKAERARTPAARRRPVWSVRSRSASWPFG